MRAVAPLDNYSPVFSQSLGSKPSGAWTDDESKDKNYYMRVRTAHDEGGKIKSALYGKIYGDFTIDPINSKTMWILFTYYLNPESNSRNIEFDPKHNLLNGVTEFDEQIRKP